MSSFRVVIPFVWVYNGKRLKVKQKLWQDCPNFWPLLYMLQNFLLVGFFNYNFAILITQQPATTNRSGWGGWWRGGWCCWWGGASRSIQWDKFVNFIYFTIPTIILVLYTYGAAFKGCVTLCAYWGKSLDVFILCPNTYQSCGKVPALQPGDRGSIPGRVRPKTRCLPAWHSAWRVGLGEVSLWFTSVMSRGCMSPLVHQVASR